MREVQLSEFGTVQNRRRLGNQVRLSLERQLSELSENETLKVNCTGVKIMDRGFASAAFGPIFVDMATGLYGRRTIGFTECNDDVSLALAGAISWAGLDPESKNQIQIGEQEL
jgi:hypothetical protein